jgi:hypothetical protein
MQPIHELHFIRSVEVIGEHALRLTFEDESIREIDLTPMLFGKLFSPLRDPNYFKQVRLEPDFQTIEWPNGADFDPETLYHWDRYRDAMFAMAEEWKRAESNRTTHAVDKPIYELQSVALTRDVPSLGLVIGDVGTVVFVHRNHESFEVEFITAEGHTLGVETLERSEVRPLSGNSIMHVRELETA